MKYVLIALLAANCLYAVGVTLWPAAPPRTIDAPAALNVPGLRLLSESARVDVVEPAAGAVDIAVLESESEPGRCLISAPFAEMAQAQRAIEAIQANGTAVELIERQTSADPADYLVYIEAPASKDAAKQLCERLASRGLECHEIPTGARAGALSVGVFSRQALAQNQLDRVSALKLPTHMAPLGPPRSEFRLMIPAVAAGATPADVSWNECASIADTPGLL